MTISRRVCGALGWVLVMGLLLLCAVTANPAIAAKPWPERSLFTQMRTVRLDDPQEAAAFLTHRAALIGIFKH